MFATMAPGSSSTTRCCDRKPSALTLYWASLSQKEPVSATAKFAPIIPASAFAVVGHRLSAAGLVQRIDDFAARSLEQLQSRDPHLGKELIDVTGDEQGDFHQWHSSVHGDGIIHVRKYACR